MAIEPKKINFDVAIKSTNHTRSYALPPEVYTSDDNAVQFRFNILDVTPEEFVEGAAVSTIEITTRDGSIFQKVGETALEDTTIVYDLKENEGNHAGLAKIQLVLQLGTKKFTSDEYEFKIINNIANKVPVEIYVQNWGTLTSQAEAYITQMAQDIEDFDVALETGILATNIAAKLQSLESTYAPEMVSMRAQLADKVDKGGSGQVSWAMAAQDFREQVLGATPPAVVGVNSVLEDNLTDNAATWKKRTKSGSFAKIMLTGDIPNFNTLTGILTFPSDIRILVGLSYYSVPAQTVDFSALLTSSSQILILFNVTTLAFQVVSPTSLSSASHEQSVLVASIMNVTGRRKTPEMNCQFSVNNVPFVPEIERMLLAKTIPQTNQITSFHTSGVLNMIQHKDLLGNTIRTDTFIFSAGTVVEERKHNLTNTKITFTTNLSTLTTEVI